MIEKIQLNQASKRYKQDWVFRNITLEFSVGQSIAILGSNGSGKSTLLQCLSGILKPSLGEINFYQKNDVLVDKDMVYQSVSIATPYQELIEEFTLYQMIEFHRKFKKFKNDFSVSEIIEISELSQHKDKLIKNFSSGMKQRLKLALAILTNSSILLLDEPVSNLDSKAKNWYNDLIKNYIDNRIVFVCSNNQIEEFEFCQQSISIEDYKNR